MTNASTIKAQQRRHVRKAKRKARGRARRRLRYARASGLGRGVSRWLVGVVVLLHLTLVMTLWLSGLESPPRIQWMETIWAGMQAEHVFYPMIAVVIAGPILSLIALAFGGWHRVVLGLSWIACSLICFTSFADQSVTLLRVLWHQYV